MSLRDQVKEAARGLGLRIREARQVRGWTVVDLAGKIEVSERTLRNLERGSSSVSLATCLAACLLLDVDFEREVDRQVLTRRVGKPRSRDISASETNF